MEHQLAIALVAMALAYGLWVGLGILRGRSWALEIAGALASMEPGLVHLRAADRLAMCPVRTRSAVLASVSDRSFDEERLAA